VNPGFEGSTHTLTGGSINGTLPANWEDNSDWGGQGNYIVYSVDTARPHSGKASMLMSSQGDFGQVAQGVTLGGGASYQLSVWLRSDAPAGFEVQVSLNLGQEPWSEFTSRRVHVGTQWTLVLLPPAALPGSSPRPCNFIVLLFGKGKLWVDDASLQRAGAACAASYLSANARPLMLCWVARAFLHAHAGLWLSQSPC
jgi:hypothetical protein